MMCFREELSLGRGGETESPVGQKSLPLPWSSMSWGKQKSHPTVTFLFLCKWEHPNLVPCASSSAVRRVSPDIQHSEILPSKGTVMWAVITLPPVPHTAASARVTALWDISQKMVSVCLLASISQKTKNKTKKRKRRKKLTVERWKSVATEWHFSSKAELWKAKRHHDLFSFIWLSLEWFVFNKSTQYPEMWGLGGLICSCNPLVPQCSNRGHSKRREVKI